jgi:putative polymerase
MRGLLRNLPLIIIIWATVFNAVLAVINGHVVALSSAAVVAAEVAAVVLAHLLALSQFRPEMRVWYGLLMAFLVLFVLRSLVTGDPQAEYLRDVLLIPTFIVLGMTSHPKNLTPLVCVIHVVVLTVMVYEALDTPGYAKLFEVQKYYINTRGYDHEMFWNDQSDLFVSATRWQDRFFLPFLSLHRLSSIFLEPVSLGNYCVFITIYICARFSRLTVLERGFLGLGNVALLIGSDGRFAAISSVIIIVVSMLATKLPRRSALAYLPGVTLAAFAIAKLAGLHEGEDDLPGRIAYTVDLLSRYNLSEFIGISDKAAVHDAVDSGLAYVVITQSIFGLGVAWVSIIFGAREDRPEQVRYTHGLCIYLSLAMMVSSSIFSIKTAALLWFVQGSLQRRERRLPASLTVGGMVLRRRKLTDASRPQLESQ